MFKFLKRITKDHFLVFLLLCCSGNPAWVFVNDMKSNYILCAIFVGFLLLRQKQINSNGFMAYLMPFALISLLQVAVVSGATISSGIFLLLKMVIGFGIISTVGYRFPKVYVETMTFVAVISLLGFVYNNFVGMIPGVRHSEVGVSIYVYNQLYGLVGGYVDRNCGMFWEPGAFQGYLNMAIMFSVLMERSKWNKFSLILMIVAVLTTKSTTGYAVLAFIATYYIIFHYNGKPIPKPLCIVALISLFMYYYTRLDFLQDKMETQTFNGEEEGRLNDYIRFIPLFKEHFLFGMSTEVANEAATGNGFLSFLLYYGIFGVAVYFGTLWNRLKRQCNTRVALFVFAIVFLTLQGEGFVYYPCYLAWPFLMLRLNNEERIVEC